MSTQRQMPLVTKTSGATSSKAENVFPQSVVTAGQSLIFMHRTLAVCFSSIAYLRNMFKTDAFSMREWEGCQLPIINSNDPRSKKLIKYVKGIFDAMKHRYLRQVILGISCDWTNAEKVVEAYTFRFHYAEGGPSVTMSGHNSEHESSNLVPVQSSKGDVVRLIRQMSFFVKSLNNLPSSDAYFTIKLLYYDDRTPADYEPPGFEATKMENFDFGTKKIVALDMGRVKTSFHSCRVGVRSTVSVDLEKSPSSPSKENANSTMSYKRQKMNGSKEVRPYNQTSCRRTTGIGTQAAQNLMIPLEVDYSMTSSQPTFFMGFHVVFVGHK